MGRPLQRKQRQHTPKKLKRSKKKEAAAEAKAPADKLNSIAGAATKKLNDAKQAADKDLKDATEKKAAAEGMIAKIDNAQCAKHSGCKGMEGYCCPTLNFAKMHLGSAKLDGA